ncbi:hypothetical protein DYB35_002745 [Aphanomyces astaci]|uniref:Mitogen-activated protein kinase n=1 Tax=Aphanomyces astaci TaxID=112090 RepID=A0A3R7AID3_APHAT|nr:hypothetical protein DYB35_002745 [Aphanomyces astaci]
MMDESSNLGLAWARFDLRVRGGLMSAIYGRTLELTLAERSAIGMGKLTNYISVDVGRVVGMPGGVFDMVLIPVEIVVALILLSREVSYAFVAGLVVLGVMLPLQTWLGNQLQSITRNMLQFRDDRVELSSEAIKSIRVLKLEMGQLGARKYLDALCVVFWASTPVVVQSAVFVAVIYSGHDLTAANAFVAIALLDRLIYPMNYFPWIINGFLEARVSALRLRSFLFAPVVSSSAATRQASVSLWHQCTFAWTPNPSAPNEGAGDGEEDAAPNPTTALLTRGDDDVVTSRPAASFECHLEHFQLDPTHMHVLVGASGSGKSSMLLAMLGEMPMVHGRHIGPPRLTSYAPQVPWLFAATIRYNITLDADDKSTSSDLYRRVLAACALEQDLACHPLGDLTVLSDHGANLSGGQRARLGLARALYQRADVYLLDDVMGSLDVATATHVLRSAPAVLPPAASVVLATHAVHLLEHIARPYSILVLEHGRVVEVGSYAELTCRESTRFRTMLQVASGVVRSTSEANVDKDGNGQTSSSSQQETVSPPDQSSNTPDEEHRDDGVVAAWMWWQYLRSMGVCVLGMLALSVLVMQVSRNGLDYWIASYTSSSVHHPISPPSFARGLVVITAINIVAVTARSFLFAYGGLRAANALYRRLVHRLVRAPLTFYDITPVGRILNRLGGDTYGVDESLPFVLNIFLKDAADVCGTLVILVLTTPAVFLVLGPLTIVYFALQQWYRPTSRHLRRLDAVAQSPLVMMFQATLDGLPILRGLKCEPQWFRVYLHRLHQAQRVSFLASGAGAWFGLRLDSLGVAVTTFVAGYAAVQCYVGRPIPSGVLGLTLIYALPIVGKCNAILSSFIATEQNMVSVERVLEYASVPVEEEDDGSARGGAAASWTDTATVDGQTTRNDHLVNWPPLGHVTLTNVSVRYGEDAMRGLPAALHGVTCHIMAKEKVGICGRTGAGKSTLLQCLFRAVPFGGRIVIDGIDIASMSLTRLRASLCFVPQDAVLFKGSIRANVDPMDSLTDAAIWTALAQCCLKDVVEAFPLGLMEPLLQGGDQGRLSRGQAQLLCICRALLRKSKVVCVDEATASIDHGTEQLVQSTMAQAFKDSTVLTVAHRLHTILDSDRVLVLDEGKVVEFDSPKTLRSIPNGYFAALVDGHSAVGNGVQVLSSEMTKELTEQGKDLLLGALSGGGGPDGAAHHLSLPAPVVSTKSANTSPIREDGIESGASSETSRSLPSSSKGASRPPPPTHEVHWEGYVRKKGDWLPRWEERYLVLDGASLTYYNSKDEARTGTNLRGRMIITKVLPENYGKAHGFLIETMGHKHFHLCCTTELEKDMWVEMMQAAIDEGVPHPHQLHSTPHLEHMSSSTFDVNVQVHYSPTQVDLRSFYSAFRKLLISHSSSPQFFPKLSRDVVLTSNYAPTVPFWGEYHGLDGVLHFFSILYETVEFTSFFVTDIAQAQEGSTAVVAGRETMKNKHNNRKFTQQWQHTIEFAPDGRVKSLTVTADPVAASAVFGCNATSSLSLPIASVIGNTNQDNPAGTVLVHVLRGEQMGGLIDSDDTATSSVPPSCRRRLFLGMRLIVDGKTNVYAPQSSQKCVAKTDLSTIESFPDPVWASQHTLPFQGLSRGKPCFMLIEAWGFAEDGDDKEELIGVAKVNLAPFLALASSSRSVRESVVHSDIARGAVPQWYTLLSASETKFSCGRVQLSISFESESLNPVTIVEESSATNTTGGVEGEGDLLAADVAKVAAAVTTVLSKERSYRDTRRDNHSFRVGNTTFDIPKRYQMIKAVGQGAYGCVIAASDTETGQSLAIKNVPNAFNDLVDAKRILREIRLMMHLNHPYLVNLLDLIRPTSIRDFSDVYIVTDLMETDLHRVIHSNQTITDDHLQYFLYQMLVAIKYVHSAQVLHRDLKPSNILVNSDCDVKLCDFGLARGVQGVDSGLTEYVVTRWYRAPELLLSSKYDKPVDVWAIGCILAEMIGRRPLFPGQDYLHQLKIIMDVVGSPEESSLDFITNPKAKRFILKQPKKPRLPLNSIYPRATDLCLDLLDKMLAFDPRTRITIDDALEHPYLAQVRDRSVETTAEKPFDFSFEDCDLTRKKLQELIFEDVCHFHPETLDERPEATV